MAFGDDTLIPGLNQQEKEGLPIDPEVIFSNHAGVAKKSIQKRQSKLLRKLGFLKPFLQEDEKILLVTTGCSNITFMDLFFMGWMAMLLRRCLLVFTNRRIIHIPTTPGFSYRNTLAQICYGDCEYIGLRGRKLKIQYKNSHRERFLYLAKKEKRKIRAILQGNFLEFIQSQAGQRTHICPRCTGELIQNHYRCPSCNMPFKDKSAAKMVSIFFPGGGYFYTGHIFLGLSDAFVETILTIGVIASLIGAISGQPGGWFTFFFWLVILTVEKRITIRDSNRFIDEYIPSLKHIPPLPLKTAEKVKQPNEEEERPLASTAV